MTRAARCIHVGLLKAMVYDLEKKKERENGGSRHLPTLAWIR